ncbi:MAG: glucose-1-phosphate thymidylyltransferase, partial [Parcubacteria group bacterium Gr01-1014_72]
MQCIILAAGEGVRMRPLTLTTPKPLLRVYGKPIIDHILDSLPSAVDSVVLVVGYRREALIRYLGASRGGRRLEYIVQEKPTGTADALLKAREKLTGAFLLLYADDLHDPEGLRRLAAGNRLALLAAEHEH